ncbi:PepSY-like domain-containing protein [Dyadobacter chenwenxiniae]|uniref:PepSY-like domain-containing protein n=1 Tax=Dyadobacter chenwenxiniae TaxID=2906456 RepID=A0A9X1PF47_9BACT|nr:PepSY-like domain-containing protein [Dyadobacter chenwenxiniae]MCF0059972.1 PepSY-like domain-containing protein [Dyadobacter chenwenxiniae]UON85711.1 PepSY-like domain-containing protein [Dyadobacter chenwenxiniae]
MMKALSIYFIMILLAFSGCDNEKVVDETNLPPQASEFIEAHFPDAKIARVVRDRDDLLTSFDVILDNQVELEFDKQGECFSVDGNANEKLPDSVIPLKILEYVQKSYPDKYITDWEKSKTTQEVSLSDNKELLFNLSGTFRRIDD